MENGAQQRKEGQERKGRAHIWQNQQESNDIKINKMKKGKLKLHRNEENSPEYV